MFVQNKHEDLMVTTADSDGVTVMTEDNCRQLRMVTETGSCCYGDRW